MGTFFRHLFEKDGIEVLISGRSTVLTTKELCARSDIIIISVPVKKASDILSSIIPIVKKTSLIADLSSFQNTNIRALSSFEGTAIGIHPLFGPLVKNLQGQVFSFTPSENDLWVEFLIKYFESKGVKIITLSPPEHDRQMALVQSLIHFVNINLGMTLNTSDINISKEVSTPLFRLQQLVIGRVFGQSAELYENILMENSESSKTIDAFNRNSTLLSKIISDKDRPAFEGIFDETKKFLGSFIEISENKTTEILSLIDKQPVKLMLKTSQVDSENVKTAYLGPEGTYSHQAARLVFPNSLNLINSKTILDVFEAVTNGEVDFGVVPAENLIEGVVKDTLSGIVDYPIKILSEIPLGIRHCLLSRSDSTDKINTVRSHPQALGQCRIFLKNHLPNAAIEPVSSTVSSASDNDESVAIIASREAATLHGLNILAENIGDVSENVTNFYVISNQESVLFNQKPKKAILLLNVYDRVAVLRDILDVFAKKSLNLTRLVSIPTGLHSGEYYFLIDVDIQDKIDGYEICLKELKQFCKQIRVLGEI